MTKGTLTAVELDAKTDQPTGRVRYFCSPTCMESYNEFENQQETMTEGVLSTTTCDTCGKRAAKFWPQWVNAYDTNRSFGGPEEGGWWYDTGEVLASIPCFNDEQVTEAKTRLEDWLKPQFEGNHDIGSVLCEGKLQICVEDEPGKSYPETRPHYE